ncbi:polysaccharide biosynthesis protein [Candidatus Thiosymbion oneisti]|uniref:polysaccharide biosynthesis protein n=1 Tax=Candidatus Thiosymbion oneisti TaxID=589554 RepID=UPI000ADFF49C|nr:nucleoside-diphosphate sugar epimerase/dehydratase [Candidatus Thiosymbion oneisti]
MKPWVDRLRSRTAAFVHDLATVPVAWLCAYWLRFNLGVIPEPFLDRALTALPLVLLIQASVFWVFGLYRGIWRFASLPDLMRIAKAVLAGTALIFFALFIFDRMQGVPRSLPLLYLGLQMLLLAGPRLLYRRLKDHRLALHDAQRVLIVGAGRAGEMLVRDMLRDPQPAYLPVAFVDDKSRRRGSELHGIPIRGATAEIPELVVRLSVDLILLAIPSASTRQMQRLVKLCQRAGKPYRTVPPLRDLMTGQVSISQVHPVSIEDLLGRNPVQLDRDGIHGSLENRLVLVTGGGGSIGAELCRQIATARPTRLLVADNGEYNLYRIESELRDTYPLVELACALLDVTDTAAVRGLFERERPQVVFHAAAYKHVPLLEQQIHPAVRNNVLGTQVVAQAADDFGCEEFVLISTDKAVHPINIMGATKRVAEILCQAIFEASKTRFETVRFGNVLGSAGSVVPLFRRQIECGGPVTVTHPEIKRFFMTIPEACQLIMQAAAIGRGGEIFVLDMGEPIAIADLADQMIRLSGQLPGEDIAIEYVGLRPGEKLYEELFYESEDLAETAHPKIRIARRGPVPESEKLARGLEALEAGVRAGDEAALHAALGTLIPQWRDPLDGPQVDAAQLVGEAVHG